MLGSAKRDCGNGLWDDQSRLSQAVVQAAEYTVRDVFVRAGD